MTIEQFQRIYLISEDKTIDDIERATQMVSVYTGKDFASIDKMSVKKFDKICANIAVAFQFNADETPKTIRGRKGLYRLNYNAADIAGRYIEGVEFGRDVVMNLHKLLASCAVPVTWWGKRKKYDANRHSEYAEDLLGADFNNAYSAALFFCKLYSALMNSSRPYLVQKLVEKGVEVQTAERSIQGLCKTLDGLAQPSRWQSMSAQS